MIGMVDKEMIRRLHKVQGWSERRIAWELGFARMTVRKYLQEERVEAPRYRLTHPRAKPVLDQVLPFIRQWLADDAQQPRKQRRTAPRIGQQRRDEDGFQGGEATIRAAVRQLKRFCCRRVGSILPASYLVEEAGNGMHPMRERADTARWTDSARRAALALQSVLSPLYGPLHQCVLPAWLPR